VCPTLSKFVMDMNGDGAFTIRDVGRWLAWAFFLPGEALFNLMAAYPEFVRFFEISRGSCRGVLAGIISALLWVIVGFVLLNIVLLPGNVIKRFRAWRYARQRRIPDD
jgi:hypothetical protein